MTDLDQEDYDMELTGFATDELGFIYESAEDNADSARKTLSERFIVPPFSVLDCRQGYWLRRKEAWIALGIRGAEGRGEV